MNNNSNPARETSPNNSHFDTSVSPSRKPATPTPFPNPSQQNDGSVPISKALPRSSALAITPHMQHHQNLLLYDWQSERSQSMVAAVVNVRSKLPSPFPTAIAFSYANFNTHYWNHQVADGERMFACKELVGAMLRFYFPRPGWEVVAVPNMGQKLIGTVPWEGTFYYSVLRGGGVKESEGDGKGAEATLFVAIVTGREFLEELDRTKPTTLAFAKEHHSADGEILLNRNTLRRGHVVLLCGQGSPPRAKTRTSGSRTGHPAWEFYTFDSGREEGSEIVPWFGQTRTEAGFGTNSFTLASEEAEKVHTLFESIRNWSGEDWDVLSDTLLQSQNRLQSLAAAPRQLMSMTPAPRDRDRAGRFSVSRSTTPGTYLPSLGSSATATPAPMLPLTANPQSAIEEGDLLTYLSQFGVDTLGRIYSKKKGGSVGAEESQRVRQLAQEASFEIPGPSVRRRR